MKILPVDKIREADEYTIKNEPVASVDLMERAAKQCHEYIRKRVEGKKVKVFCGPGNNGGDGLVVARLLAGEGIDTEVYIIWFTDKGSEDFNVNLERLKKTDAEITGLKEGDELPEILRDEIVIDALFGSGLSRPVKGFPAKAIRHINESEAVVISIDMPSGLFSDQHTDEKEGEVIQADHTISFEFPKKAFLFPENEKFVGHWTVRSIGLHPDYIKKVEVKDHLLRKEEVALLYKPRGKFSHKGHFGHALLIAGSYGKMGAAVLASRAVLKSGAGLLHAHIPGKGVQVIHTAVPEAMVSVDPGEDHFSSLPDLSHYNAIGIGPAIGFEGQTKHTMKLLIQEARVPLVFDADALTILGENKTWLSFVPKFSIFTPHPKEFERMAGKASDDFERNRMQREFSVKYSAFVVLKGAHTVISSPDGTCYYNTTGNPGMASGGSGDVLTGMILGLLAQGYAPKHASIMGVYLHGLAGDLAAMKNGYEALTAQSIVDEIGKAFMKLY